MYKCKKAFSIATFVTVDDVAAILSRSDFSSNYFDCSCGLPAGRGSEKCIERGAVAVAPFASAAGPDGGPETRYAGDRPAAGVEES
jgi:hypothetical protein